MYLLNSPPGAMPSSFVRWADMESSSRYITPFNHHHTTTLAAMLKRDTFTSSVPALHAFHADPDPTVITTSTKKTKSVATGSWDTRSSARRRPRSGKDAQQSFTYGSIKSTVRSDQISTIVLPLDRPRKGHQPLQVFDI
jgi:hypothetical protein